MITRIASFIFFLCYALLVVGVLPGIMKFVAAIAALIAAIAILFNA